ncbi:hypothetical protein [Paenibacillus urinalis]|uniref:ABC transporter permease n=1 Tax=Paenibacillus urinalis TaxID=521520 RepID=A0AAX3N1A3_9BACL|nr:hypothetical protein [Paenibacillus urinalis]WDH83352.1 hypothetical protein PUW23_03655 [Paenibacillus urinalis]
MKFVLGRLKERQFIQNTVIMAVADLTMLSAGVIIGYYFKTMMI